MGIDDYKVISKRTTSQLTQEVKAMMVEGWTPVGGHGVVETHHQLQFAGNQHKRTEIQIEYSQTLVKYERV